MISGETMETPVLNPNEYYAILRTDFYSFLERCFLFLNPQTKFYPGWYMEVLGAELMMWADGRQTRRLIVNMPPRHIKSTGGSIALPAWILGHNPSAQIICVSYAQDLADKLARDCGAVMTSDWYQKVFPTRLSPQKQSAQEFETTAKGYRLAMSVGGILTGRGADYIILDDPMKPTDALSDAVRKTTNQWFDNTLLSRLNDKRTGRILVVMQRLHEDDLVGHVLQREKWDVLSFPAIAEKDEQFVLQSPLGMRRFSRKIGDALHPERET